MANVTLNTLNLTQGISMNITPFNLPFVDKIVFGNTVKEFAVAVLLFLGIVVVLKLVSWITIKIFEHIDKKHPTNFKEIIVRILKALQLPLYIVIGLKIASKTLVMHSTAEKVIQILMLIIITYYVIRAINAIIFHTSKKVIEKRVKEDNDTDTNIMNFFTKAICGVIWILGFLFILSKFGVDVSQVITGLGIAGVAVAFALQNILGDIFASISIYFDKPFKPGDYVMFDGNEGNVVRTGIKSTRIKLLRGEELVVSNKFLTESKLQNMDRMEKRRVDLDLQVKYGTPKSKLEKLPKSLEQIVKKYKKDIEFARCHLKTFKDYSIEFELIYFVKNNNYDLFMDIQQKINFDILDLFEKENMEFAFPTHTIVVEGKKN